MNFSRRRQIGLNALRHAYQLHGRRRHRTRWGRRGADRYRLAHRLHRRGCRGCNVVGSPFGTRRGLRRRRMTRRTTRYCLRVFFGSRHRHIERTVDDERRFLSRYHDFRGCRARTNGSRWDAAFTARRYATRWRWRWRWHATRWRGCRRCGRTLWWWRWRCRHRRSGFAPTW